jgi:hypothetical protein
MAQMTGQHLAWCKGQASWHGVACLPNMPNSWCCNIQELPCAAGARGRKHSQRHAVLTACMIILIAIAMIFVISGHTSLIV